MPFIVNGEFVGFIGLENCLEDRVWQSTEIAFLQATVLAISLAYKNFITKKKLHNTIEKYRNLNFIEFYLLGIMLAFLPVIKENLQVVIPMH